MLSVTKSQLSHGPNLPVSAYFASITALPTAGICRNVRLSEHQTVGMFHRRTVNVRNVPLSDTRTLGHSDTRALGHSGTQTLGTFDCPTWDGGGEESVVLKGISIKVGGVGG